MYKSRYNIGKPKKKTKFKEGKLCLGLGEQEEYLSQFQFKGNNKLKGYWIVQDWKNEFYRHIKTISRGMNASVGTHIFKKISFVKRTNIKTREKYTARVLSNQLYRLGIKRSKACSFNHNKEISFYPRDLANSECEKWYNCEKGKDCLQCVDYFNLKTVKKIRHRFKGVLDILQLSSSKKRFRAKINVVKTHYLVRGFSMSKYPSIPKKINKDSWPIKEEEAKIFYQNEFISFEKYEQKKQEEQAIIDEYSKRYD